MISPAFLSAIADLIERYVKSLVSSLTGRLSYFVEKVVFSGIWAAMMLIAGVVCHLICMLPLIGAVPTWLWGALTGLLWTAIGGGAFLLIASKRDL